MKNLLLYIIASPLIGIFLLFLVPSWNKLLIKQISLIFSGISFVLSMAMWVGFHKSIGGFQGEVIISWGTYSNLSFTVGVDGISIFLIILTTLLIPLCVLVSWNNDIYAKDYFISWLFDCISTFPKVVSIIHIFMDPDPNDKKLIQES